MTARPFFPPCSLLLALALTTTACGDDDDAPSSARGGKREDAGSTVRRDAGADAQKVLTGTLADSDVWLGAVVTDQSARIFFCGGPSSYATATSWLRAELDDDGRFSFASDALDIQGQLDDDGLHGELIRGDEPAASFSAQPVRASTLAGLYEAESGCGRVGLIVRPSSTSAPRAQGACVGPGHDPEQVNPILPVSLDDDGSIAVEVLRADGSLEPARVRRAAP